MTGDATNGLTRRALIIVGVGLAAADLPRITHEPEMTMEIYSIGSGPTRRAPEATFTGDVQIGGYFRREAPSRLLGASAQFPPGARTPWKVNPSSQTLVVTDGVGWAQCEGEEIIEIRTGDMLWCPPGRRHWEGATPDRAMTYIALHEVGVEFGAQVTDEQYQEGPTATGGPRSGEALG